MPFPNLEGKHAGRPFVTPRRLLEYRATQERAPRVVVLGWQPSLEKQVRERRECREIPGPAGALAVVLPGGLGFARVPIGAPAAAIVVEELAALGSTWTTDAPYRETAEEIAQYRDEGILTVDMEAAALFTVARLSGLAAASVFCVSDVLHGEEWEPHFSSADVRQALWTLFEAAEACLPVSGAAGGSGAPA